MMKIAVQRLTAVTIVFHLLGPLTAFADYDGCMKWCTKEHSFSHCNLQCGLAGGGRKADDKANGTAPKSDEPCIDLSHDEQADLIAWFVKEHYGPAFSMIYQSDDHQSQYRVRFFPSYPEERECEGEIKILTDCSTITDLNGNDLSNEGWREQTLPCE